MARCGCFGVPVRPTRSGPFHGHTPTREQQRPFCQKITDHCKPGVLLRCRAVRESGRRRPAGQERRRRGVGAGTRKAPPVRNWRGLTLAGRTSRRSTESSNDYLLILVTLPEPTVRPPSRIAKPRPSSMAMGWISSTLISVLSPGMTISVPSGSVMTPVTSVVRK